MISTERRPSGPSTNGLAPFLMAFTTSSNCRVWPWWPMASGSAAPPPPLLRAAIFSWIAASRLAGLTKSHLMMSSSSIMAEPVLPWISIRFR